MSDIHIGAFRQEELKEPLMKAFETAIDICMQKEVDFVIMAGDIFDSNIPDLQSVRRAASKVREAAQNGIRFYVVYGSHDFSPNYASIVDVLESAGLFKKVEVAEKIDGRIHLKFIVDPSGAKLCGISGKRLSLDRFDYESLDSSELTSEVGFKIFVFHGAIEELKPSGLGEMEAMPADLLPEGFDYYAGGHVHNRSLTSLPGRPNIAYPGPLFGGDYRDLEPVARGEKRGMYIVDFGKGVNRIDFIPIEPCEIAEFSFDAGGMNPVEASRKLHEIANTWEVKDRIILLRVYGQLSGGRTTEVDIATVKKELVGRGAKYVLVNSGQLMSRETMVVEVRRTKAETEAELFGKQITTVKVSEPSLKGEKGVKLSLDLLRSLREGRKENETKGDYEDRILKAGSGVLKLEVEQK
jgi:DNA repair exonuclease SbcCD nuclease subunit